MEICPILCVHYDYYLHSSGIVEQMNEVSKTQLTKLIESFHLPWSKALSLVLLNLRSTPFGKH